MRTRIDRFYGSFKLALKNLGRDNSAVNLVDLLLELGMLDRSSLQNHG